MVVAPSDAALPVATDDPFWFTENVLFAALSPSLNVSVIVAGGVASEVPSAGSEETNSACARTGATPMASTAARAAATARTLPRQCEVLTRPESTRGSGTLRWGASTAGCEPIRGPVAGPIGGPVAARRRASGAPPGPGAGKSRRTWVHARGGG